MNKKKDFDQMICTLGDQCGKVSIAHARPFIFSQIGLNFFSSTLCMLYDVMLV